MNKRILYQSDYELFAFYVKGKTLTKAQYFKINEAGETQFARYLSQDIKTPIYWLLDTTQEEYQIALLPHVLGQDRSKLMNHKKKRLFESATYTYGVVQGREAQGRRDDRALFMALNNPNLLQPWLNLITTFKIPLAGIYSLPLLSEHLLKYLPKAPYTLLVAHTPPIGTYSAAGLRQSFFLKQKLQLSRLIPLDMQNPQEYTNYILTQITTMHRYLENTRRLAQLEQPSPLSVIILTDTPFVSTLTQRLKEGLPNLTTHLFDTHELARQLGLQLETTDDWYLYHFVAYTLARRWYSKNHYAQPRESSYFFHRQLRLGIYLSSLLLVSSAAVASWLILENTYTIKQQGQKIADKINTRQDQLNQLRDQVPNLPVDIEIIRNVVDVGFYIKNHHVSPQPAWEKLSQILNHHPKLQLEQLEWNIGEEAEHIWQSYFKSDSQLDEYQADDSADPDSRPFFLESIRVHGKIVEPGNYQTVSHLFRQFLTDLKQESGFWQVKEQRSPYNPNQTLQGRLGSRPESNEVLFTIDIFIKHYYAQTSY